MTRLLHLSDTHVSATGPDMDGVDAIGALEQVLRDARHVPALDAVVISGDVADDGSPAGYAAVRERIGRFAAERGIPQIYSTGNHDDRPAFGSVLGLGHLDPGGAQCGVPLEADAETRAAVSEVGALRVVTLDSLVPGQTAGHVDSAQLARLADLLATPSSTACAAEARASSNSTPRAS